MTNDHVMRFLGTPAGFEEAARNLRAILDQWQLDDGPRYNVELVFEEIATNIVRHGRPTAEIDVAIAFDDDEVRLTFDDDGVPFDPRNARDVPAPTSIDDAPVGGLGLVLVRKVSTRIDYERTSQHRNHLTLVIPAR